MAICGINGGKARHLISGTFKLSCPSPAFLALGPPFCRASKNEGGAIRTALFYSVELCMKIDERVKAFLRRPLPGKGPNIWLDASYPRCKCQLQHRYISSSVWPSSTA